MMARFSMLVATALFIFGGFAMADVDGDVTAHVFVEVNPNITVGAVTSNVNLGTIQTGDIPGNVTFRIDANVERCSIAVGATQLYKGDDPTDPSVDPILVDEEIGAVVTIPDGNPVQGGSTTLMYYGPWDYNMFAGHKTEYRTYESSQDGFFSQDVFVTVGWYQPNPELTVGEYSGFVGMWAAVVL
jgi:hypothetical protein